MRNNVIAFGLLAVILTAELWVIAANGDGLYQALISKSGECLGPTTDYHADWGMRSWDCDGNRLPNEQQDNVAMQMAPRDPEADIVRHPPPARGARNRPHTAPYQGGEH